jgi:hypothetical protein
MHVGCRDQASEGALQQLLHQLKANQLSISFETVYQGFSEHGQLPIGDYLVLTSICHMLPDGQIHVRASLQPGEPYPCILRPAHLHIRPGDVATAYLQVADTSLAGALHAVRLCAGAAVDRAAALLPAASPACQRCLALHI